MIETHHLKVKHHQIELSGVLNFDSVVELREQGFLAIETIESEKIIVDFSAVTKSDSSGLALMLSWLRYANKKNKTIQFMKVPQAIENLANSCQIKEILWIN